MHQKLKQINVIIAFLLPLSVSAANNLYEIENQNTLIHTMNKEAEQLKVKLSLDALKEQQIRDRKAKNLDKFIIKNNAAVKMMESRFELLKQTALFDIKNGHKNLEDIRNEFLREKVSAIILSEQIPAEVLQQKITLLEKNIAESNEYINELNANINDLQKSFKDKESDFDFEIDKLQQKISAQITQIRSLERCESSAPGCVDEVQNVAEKNILIVSLEATSVLLFKDLKRFTLAITYNLTDDAVNFIVAENIQVSNKRSVLIPGFGIIKITTSEDNIITISDSDGVVLFTQPLI
jgi:DNA repair ATPase RecN